MLFAAILAFAVAALAAPLAERNAVLCTSGTPQCCATDVLGLADLNCAAPPVTPNDINDFINQCAAEGQQAQCCDLPILDQALICSTVNPTAQPTST